MTTLILDQTEISNRKLAWATIIKKKVDIYLCATVEVR